MTLKYHSILLFLLFLNFFGYAQNQGFTRQDSLRGTITPEREWWDLTYYHLSVNVNPLDSSIIGTNLISYRVLKPNQGMQIDLQPPMQIDKITQNGVEQQFERDGNAWFVTLKKLPEIGEINEVLVEFSGKPRISRRPPWDGGLSWKKDGKGRPFIANANQGDGASLWWPCKDHPFDEPDSMLISVTFPNDLMDVSNGTLRKVEQNNNGTKTAHWFVSNPINNYGVNINIGNYVHFSDVYKGEKGNLNCDYWVLDYNLDKAKEQFKQVHLMLEAFEHWFGPYPFYEDGYKLVEAPYLGMEHQSSVTYGNGFKNGYRGSDLSESGYGLKFDYIIVHESGHEWFANNITNADEADMWIHESFTTYSECLFVEYFYGKEAGAAYCRGLRLRIDNDRPVQGIYGVNYPGSGDMYPKGANMIHTLRQLVNDDKKWRGILRGLNETFYHQTVTSEQIENYLSEQTGLELKGFFNQYLRDTRIPILEYVVARKQIHFRWTNTVPEFKMKLKVYVNGEERWIEPGHQWQSIKLNKSYKSFRIDPDFYVAGFLITAFE